MPTIEKDILMNNKKNGNTEILYPVTKGSNVLCGDDMTVEEKMSGLAPTAFSIAVASWAADQSTGLYTATIADSSVTASDMADVVIDAATYAVAAKAGVKAYTTEVSGGIQLYADSIPTAAISGKYIVNRGGANG